MRSFFRMCVIMLGLGGIAACGGNVVVDGNAGADPVVVCQQACEKLSAQCDVPGGQNCAITCADQVADVPETCQDELAALYQCILGLPSDNPCDFSNVCEAEGLAYANCLSTGSGGSGGISGGGGSGGIGGTGGGTGGIGGGTGGGSTGCDVNECYEGSDGSCGCKGICGGVTLGVECVPQSGGSSCTCIMNGDVVGGCSGPAESCDLQTGCCAEFFGQGV